MNKYEPTKEERKNGWTAESIQAYAESREEVSGGAAIARDKYGNAIGARPTHQVRRHPFQR